MKRSPLEGKTILAVIGGTELLGSERGNLEALLSLQTQGAHIIVGVSGRVAGGGAVGEQARTFGFETFELPFGSHFAYQWMRRDRGYRNRQIKRIWTNSWALSQAIRKYRPTHLMFSTVLAYIFCCLALIWHRTPLIYRIGDAPASESRFQMFWWRSLVRRSTTLVTISDFIQREVKTYSPANIHKCEVIRNKIITRGKEERSAELTKRLKTSTKKVQLVYVGNITNQKGVPQLIQAVLKVSQPILGLWVVGGGQHSGVLEESLKAIVSSSNSSSEIVFFGYQDDPRPYFSCANWHIASSTSAEALGNVVLEAKYAGTPSIVSPIGGLPELIQHEVDGLILDSASTADIIETISVILRGEYDAVAMGLAAKDSLLKRFNADAFAQQWAEVILKST